jgi:hypothetical protein
MKRLPHPHCSVNSLLALCGLLLASCAVLAVLATAGRPAHAQLTRIIFLHHSCGENLINQGGVREGLTALGYEFYDHGYNGDGLRLADGSYTGTNFDVPGDNTDPDGVAAIFAQPLRDPPDNTFSHLMEYDVIAFKSCFPVSNIADDYQLNEYKSYYLSVRDRMDQYPGKIFIVVTQPPQVPGASNADEARRAHALAAWLKSDEFAAGHPNVFTFDFFDHLAGDDHFLRSGYRVDEYDAHPNEQANREIGPRFVSFVDQAIRSYDTEAPRPATVAPTQLTQPPVGTVVPSPPTEAPPIAAVPGLIDDFESAAGRWESSAAPGSTVECAPDTATAHSGRASLAIRYTVTPGGWADCGRSFESPQNWSSGEGISMAIHIEGAPPAQWVKLMLFSGDPEDPTPFEVDLEIPPESSEGWSQVGFYWASFEVAEWASEGGLSEVDPMRVIGYGLNLGAGETSREGTIWIDDLGLSEGPSSPLVAATPTVAATASMEAQSAPTPTPTAVSVASAGERGEETGGEEGPARGICPGAAWALPLAALSALAVGRRRT